MACVLVVDDDKVSLQLMEIILKRDSHSVIITNRVGETIRLIQHYRPDLVILDDMMPSISGGELCRNIKRNPDTSATPVILMSAGMRIRDPDYVRDVRADDVLLKPCLPAQVRDMVNRHALSNQSPSESV